MRHGFLGSLTAVLAGAGVALAQGPAPTRLPSVQPVPAVQAPGAPTTAAPATAPSGARPAAPANVVSPATQPGTSTQAMPAPNGNGPGGHEPSCKCCEPPFTYNGPFYADFEYLLGWTKGNKLPPLITTGSPGTLTTTAALGQPGTVVLFGDEDVDSDVRSGGRLTAGYWLNPEQTVGLETSFFMLEPQSTSFGIASSNTVNNILARPYVNLDLVNAGISQNLSVNTENSLLLALPTLSSGSATATTRNEVWGVEANGRVNVSGNSWYRADMLLGFRFLDVRDELAVGSFTSPASSNSVVIFNRQPFTGAEALGVSVVDSFRTRNDYYGGQVGGHLELRRGRFSSDFRGKLALGVMHQEVDINGFSTLFPVNGASTTVPGGLLAQTSNIGKHSRDEFGIVPEAGLNLGYWVTDAIRLTVGYSVIYFRSDVVRPGTEIDRVVNPSLVPTLNIGAGTNEQRPAFGYNDVDFWVQAINFGIELSF